MIFERQRLDIQPAAVKRRKAHGHPGAGNVVQREGHVERHAIMDEPQGFIQRLVPQPFFSAASASTADGGKKCSSTPDCAASLPSSPSRA
jgi:hypothetical protein